MVAAFSGCSTSPGAPKPEGVTATPTNAAPTTVAPTTTTVDPGTLPQTRALPSQDDPAFRARVQALWRAIVDGNPSEGAPAFFPLQAYLQVKAISDPVHDDQTRLIANYDEDILSLHASVAAAGGQASFESVQVPPTAEWILPGVEYNKGSYWRVYGTAVTYMAGGQRHTFEIHSLTSWRGEWYVVHLGAIR
ncbi:MAG TPA: hypothetical protein VFZ97_01710 [Acidimicrobiales bacterium]